MYALFSHQSHGWTSTDAIVCITKQTSPNRPLCFVMHITEVLDPHVKPVVAAHFITSVLAYDRNFFKTNLSFSHPLSLWGHRFKNKLRDKVNCLCLQFRGQSMEWMAAQYVMSMIWNVFITEREAAFNLLSIYNNNGNIEAKTPKRKERVKIALQVLERYVLKSWYPTLLMQERNFYWTLGR